MDLGIEGAFFPEQTGWKDGERERDVAKSEKKIGNRTERKTRTKKHIKKNKWEEQDDRIKTEGIRNGKRERAKKKL